MNEQTTAHQSDIATIGRILMAEANERGWCSEYDQIVSRINREITVPLPVRTNRYRITYVPPPQPVAETTIELDVPVGEDRETALQRAVPGASIRNSQRI